VPIAGRAATRSGAAQAAPQTSTTADHGRPGSRIGWIAVAVGLTAAVVVVARIAGFGGGGSATTAGSHTPPGHSSAATQTPPAPGAGSAHVVPHGQPDPSHTQPGTPATPGTNGTHAGQEATEPGGQAPAAVEPALLAVNARPWAEVRLGRRSLGTTPLRRVSLPPGNHTLELTCPPLGRSAHVRIHAVSGEAVQVFVDLDADPPTITVH